MANLNSDYHAAYRERNRELLKLKQQRRRLRNRIPKLLDKLEQVEHDLAKLQGRSPLYVAGLRCTGCGEIRVRDYRIRSRYPEPKQAQEAA